MITLYPTYSADSIYSTVTVKNNLSANKIFLKDVVSSTASNPITATGEFLKIKINENFMYIKIFNGQLNP